MILIGQYDSPFVRRVAMALRLYGLPFEHRPWSTFGDADKIARVQSAAAGADAGARRRRGVDREYGHAGLSRRTGRARRSDDRRRAGRQRRHALQGLRAGQRARRQGGQPDLRAGAAQGSAEALGRALRGPDRRRARRAGTGARRGRRRRTGSASASAMPTSWSPARCASPARRIRRCSTASLSGAGGACGACEALPVFVEIVQQLDPPKG